MDFALEESGGWTFLGKWWTGGVTSAVAGSSKQKKAHATVGIAPVPCYLNRKCREELQKTRGEIQATRRFAPSVASTS